jgi:hypothetical protein
MLHPRGPLARSSLRSSLAGGNLSILFPNHRRGNTSPSVVQSILRGIPQAAGAWHYRSITQGLYAQLTRVKTLLRWSPPVTRRGKPLTRSLASNLLRRINPPFGGETLRRRSA